MVLSKKHYELVAKILSENSSHFDIVRAFAKYFEEDNKKFNKQRFFKAVGGL